MEAFYKSEQWETLVPITELRPGYESTRLHYFPLKSSKIYTHLRLNIFPDGGIARLKTYGIMKAPSFDRLLRLFLAV